MKPSIDLVRKVNHALFLCYFRWFSLDFSFSVYLGVIFSQVLPLSQVACKISLSMFHFFYKSVSSGRFPTTKPTFSFRFCFLSQSIGNFFHITFLPNSPFLLTCSDSPCLCHWVFFLLYFINLIFIFSIVL